MLNNILMESMSYMDSNEGFYHGLMLGIFTRLQDFEKNSNRESGAGRSDIMLCHRSGRGKAVILEFKWVSRKRKKTVDLQKECDDALKQIEDNRYAYDLQEEGYTDIIKYGIAFCGKYCEVKGGS